MTRERVSRLAKISNTDLAQSPSGGEGNSLREDGMEGLIQRRPLVPLYVHICKQ